MINSIATGPHTADEVHGTSQTSASVQQATPYARRQIGGPENIVDAHYIVFETTEPEQKLFIVVGSSVCDLGTDSHIQNIAPRLQVLGVISAWVNCEFASMARYRLEGVTLDHTMLKLVSFGSPQSRQRLAKAHQTSNFTAKSFMPATRSMVEQMYAALASVPEGQAFNLTFDLRLSRLQLESNPVLTDTLSGQIHLEHLDDGQWKPFAVKFQEFSPSFKTKCLNAEVLLEILDQLDPAGRITKGSSNAELIHMGPHFYSGRGIGQSPTLAVLWAFQKICAKKGGFHGADLDTQVLDLVEQGRRQRSDDFVSTPEQLQELLKACQEVNRRVISPGPTGSIDANIIKLCRDIPEGVIQGDPRLPYMPIRVEGILDIANRPDEFPFPALTTDQAKQYSSDVVRAGFYGDALGAELDGRPFEARLEMLKSCVTFNLNQKSAAEKTQFAQAFKALGDEPVLIRQMQQQNIYPKKHRATENTQLGVLSALAKMGWLLDNASDLNQLPASISDAFGSPQLPLQSFENGQGQKGDFAIRGGAGTHDKCQLRADKEWRDRSITKLSLDRIGSNKNRSDATSNESMMRIGYDLLPLLASKASMQNLVEQALLSNQVTHSSSLSAVASVGQVVLMAKCMHLRAQAELMGQPVNIPEHIFINTFYEVAKALEGPRRYTLELDSPYYPRLNKAFAAMEPLPDEKTQQAWATERLPSEILNGPSEQHIYTDAQAKAITRSSVKQALLDCKTQPEAYIHKEAILQRWNSRYYLGATLPSVVFLMETYGYTNPARAVEMTALLTHDSNTCATIVAQVMGALHGPKWIPDTKELGFDDMLGNGFYSVQQFVGDLHAFHDTRGQK
ncbi:MAG: ADP-ribosylglycohydrolase family protein [Limnobacter sp.]|nr:ADP-ribosylglycohydrolase family protein [Limnobacter sp.]